MASLPDSLPVVLVVGVCTTVVVLLVTDVVLPGVVSVLVSVTVLAGVVTVVVLPGSVTVVVGSAAPVAVPAAWEAAPVAVPAALVTADFAFCATVPEPADPHELTAQATTSPETSATSSFRGVP
jgi:hypothetical protein